MNKPSCNSCGTETQWYGWLHGWLCPFCQAEELEEPEVEDEAVENSSQKSAITRVNA